MLEQTYWRVTELLPSSWAARADLLVWALNRSTVLGPIRQGGPMNGQERRREIVRDIACAVHIDLVVETGTSRGSGTEFFDAIFGVPVMSVEADPRSFAFSRRRLAPLRSVEVVLGDSRDFLRSIAATRANAETAAFFYLDAHGTSDLPLPEEVEIVVANWPKAIVMIDDFQVPGDDGYGFDNYGLGKALTADVLPKDLLDGWRFLYPTAPSTSETGAVRGCVVLISPLIAEVADCIPSLTSR